MRRFVILLLALPVVAFLALFVIGYVVTRNDPPIKTVPEPKAGVLAGLIADLRKDPHVDSVRMIEPRGNATRELLINGDDAWIIFIDGEAVVGGYRWKDDLTTALREAVERRRIPIASLTKAQEREVFAAR